MSTIGFTQTKYPLQIATPASDTLLVQSIEGEEALSSLFEFRVQMISESASVDFSAIVNQPVTLKIATPDGSFQYINGVVCRFQQLSSSPRFTSYFAVLYPALWRLTKTSNCRIYQNKSAPDIVKSILSDHGITDLKDLLTGTYDARDYCVQYNESDFQFISRLLESEGIFYFFEHTDGVHTLVLGDDSSAFGQGPSQLNVGPSEGAWERVDSMPEAVLEQQVVTGQVKSDDYNFETPDTDLLGTASGSDTALSVYYYPAGPMQQAKVESLMNVRLEELELGGKTLSGNAYNAAVRAGSKFTLADHARADANTTYVVWSVAHKANQESYSNTFQSFPQDAVFRPARVTPAPRIAGCQTATVVGKSGEEIWVDQYGRIKVQFHWDQLGVNDENSSCWVRVAQSWAGKAWGALFLPRIGQEVVVSFLEGDPDRPLITGSVYNATQTVPYTLPDDQTKSTVKSNSSKGGAGFNEIRFEDKKDSEELFLHAQKDMVITVLNDQTSTITNNRTITISEVDDKLTVSKGKRTVEVTQGDESLTVGGKRTVSVTGDESHTNSAKLTYDITGDCTIKVGGNYNLEVSGNATIKVTGTLTLQAQSVEVKADTGIAIKAGTEFAAESGTSFSTKAGTTMTNEASASLTSKSSATHTVEAGAILTLKGALVKIN